MKNLFLKRLLQVIGIIIIILGVALGAIDCFLGNMLFAAGGLLLFKAAGKDPPC